MTEQEPNNYKAALFAARQVIGEQRALVNGDSSMASPITSKIAGQEGWICAAADEWVAEFAERCTPVSAEFDTAWDEIDAEWRRQRDEVDANDWRGHRYNNPHRAPVF